MKVDDLVRQIRTEANAQGPPSPDDSAPATAAQADLEKLRAASAVARRAQNQLPPIVTYRRGLLARLELWVKRRLQNATRWFTWEQTNFNAATVTSMESTARLLGRLVNELAQMRSEIQDGGALSESDGSTVTRLAAVESSVRETLKEIQSERTAQARRIDLLIEEQRVCFRQLALEISENAIVSDRAKRNLEMQISELSRRLDEMGIEKAAGQGR